MKLYNGYIKLHRQMLDWEWYSNIPVKILFLHCLLRANHKDNKWQGITIEKGSFITSYEKLSIETGLTIKQIRTALDKLKMTGEVASKTTNQYSIISIKNWDKYQAEGKQEGKPRANKGQAEGKQRATNNNDKNEENEENIYYQDDFQNDYQDDYQDEKQDEENNIYKKNFQKFWNLCPKQTDELKCYGTYVNIISEGVATYEEIENGMRAYSEYVKNNEISQKYISSPFNWLNGRRWQDKLDTTSSKKLSVIERVELYRRKKENEQETVY